MIKILIGDDHPLIREGLKSTIERELDLKVVCEAQSGQEILDKLGEFEIDILVMDISMPDKNGFEVLDELKQRENKPKILILTMHAEKRYAIRALKSGASGYLTKENAAEELVIAIRRIARGGKYITPSLAEMIASELENDSTKPIHELLSDREFSIFCLIASGSSPREIAEKLGLSVNTVNTYRARILEKMDLKTNAEIIQYALGQKLIDPIS